ncbi:hypothetical protein [Aeromonas media]|uniref:hypothetical protein n=1 Tax=Aeromonas media TaxID=651 RepID=UPI0018CC92D0
MMNYAGIFFWIAGFILTVRFLEGRLANRNVEKTDHVMAVLVASVGYCSITSDFPWLLVTFEYVYFFQAILLLFIFDRYINGGVSNFVFYSFLFLCSIFSETIGFTSVLVVLAFSFLGVLFRFIKPTVLIMVVATVVLALALQFITMGFGIGHGGQSKLTTIVSLLNAPYAIFSIIGASIVQPLLDVVVLKWIFGEEFRIVQNFIAFIISIFFVCFLVFLIKYWNRKLHMLPLLFMAYSFGAAVLIMISRYTDFGISILDAQRFTRLFSLYYVGFAFMIAVVPGFKRGKLIMTLFVVLCFTTSSVYQIENSHYVVDYFNNIQSAFWDENHLNEVSKTIGRCNNGFCDKAIEFLREEKLSIYHK